MGIDEKGRLIQSGRIVFGVYFDQSGIVNQTDKKKGVVRFARLPGWEK
jgi:hypothetical protein